MKIEYVAKRFSAKHSATVEMANIIINEYHEMGYSLTLRQLYYQFVARDLIPNTLQSYKNLACVINDARLAGLIDWNAIEDRTRFIRESAHWKNPRSIVNACIEQYRLDKWENQDTRVEVWIEKDALVGVIEKVCTEHDVPFFSCRGYVSQSEMWGAAQRVKQNLERGQKTTILHLGDHDPSGKDMTRDVRDRILLFAEVDTGSVEHFEVVRLALNIDQIKRHKCPPNPAKISDSRAKEYIKAFGKSSWELDALPPEAISRVIEKNIREFINQDLWAKVEEQELGHKRRLTAMAEKL